MQTVRLLFLVVMILQVVIIYGIPLVMVLKLLQLITDWVDEVFKTGVRQNHNVNLSGGGENNTYNIGLLTILVRKEPWKVLVLTTTVSQLV